MPWAAGAVRKTKSRSTFGPSHEDQSLDTAADLSSLQTQPAMVRKTPQELAGVYEMTKDTSGNEKRGLWYLFWRSYKTSLLSIPQCTL